MRRRTIRVIRINRLLLLLLLLSIGLSVYAYNLDLQPETVDDQEGAVDALSWAVANRLIVIDPGHGGIDPGAVGPSGVQEKDVVLTVSKKLAAFLAQAGAVVLLTRENDRDLTGLNEGSLLDWDRYEIAERVDTANKRKADIYLSIHCNAIASPAWRGAQMFYHSPSAESKRLAVTIQNEVAAQLKNTDREPLPADYYTLREAKMPSVTVELGFLSNPEEEKLLNDDEYQSRMAWAIYSGVVKYFAGTGDQTNKEIPEPTATD